MQTLVWVNIDYGNVLFPDDKKDTIWTNVNLSSVTHYHIDVKTISRGFTGNQYVKLICKFFILNIAEISKGSIAYEWNLI